MVFFTCNNCGDSLKKAKVEQHVQQCRTNSFSCMDCFKDFNLKNYDQHNECISEEQKYGGPNLSQKQLMKKGKNKQNEWISKIKSLVEQNTYPKEINSILNSLIKYENIPRKKAKFLNFIRNSFRIRNDNLIEKIWNIFEESIKNDRNQNGNNNPLNNNNNQENKPNQPATNDLQNGNHDNMTNGKHNDDEPYSEHQNNEGNGNNVIKIDKKQLKALIIDLLQRKDGRLSKKKLLKKILKKYLSTDLDSIEYKEQIQMKIAGKLDKFLLKKKFIQCDANDDNIITLITQF